MCVAFQISLDYTNFEFGIYASLYYHYGLQLAIFCMIALFVNSLVQNKYMGMGIFGFIVLLSLNSGFIGLEHPLTSLGFMPRVSYSNMNGFNTGATIFNHLALYWTALGLLLTVISFKIWNRGVVASFSSTLKEVFFNWTKLQKLSTSILLLVFISAGSLVFYNVNIVNEYTTSSNQLEYRENYERKFKQFENLERPIPIARKTEVDIYHNQRSYSVKADYILKNKSGTSMSKIFISERVALKNIAIENATLILQDSTYGSYLFELDVALQPNDSVRFTYELKKSLKGYEEDNMIVNNGSYITHRNFEPILGYSAGYEISNRIEREKRGLPKRIVARELAAHIVSEDVKNEKIRFETIVSTSKDQTAISSGSLINEWIKNDRNYYHYKSKNKILPSVAYFSANYATQKTDYKGISIEQYYDSNHNFNIDQIENSIKATLDYCQENFGAYNFEHVRIAEVPSHWSFGGFAHPGVISMVEDRMYLADVSNSETFNLAAKRTIHEVAHQWWGHTLSAKPVAGGSLLVEGLAKYTEAVVMEKLYGKSALYELSDNARRRYFSGRSFGGSIEPPIYMVTSQSYLAYGKAYTVLMGLRDLIGEKQVNHVLKTLTDKHRNINKLAVNTIELLNEIYKVTPQEQRVLVDDWFKKVITYDLGIEESSYKELSNGTYELTLKVKAKRFETLQNGEIKSISIDEPIKIGVFSIHPSKVKDDNSVLYYNSSQVNKEMTKIIIIVNEKPSYVSIDPYGTRSDENLVDNIFKL